MARKQLTVKERIEKSKIEMNERYNATVDDIIELRETEKPFDAVYDAFRYGYIQGVKAAKAEARRAGV